MSKKTKMINTCRHIRSILALVCICICIVIVCIVVYLEWNVIMLLLVVDSEDKRRNPWWLLDTLAQPCTFLCRKPGFCYVPSSPEAFDFRRWQVRLCLSAHSGNTLLALPKISPGSYRARSWRISPHWPRWCDAVANELPNLARIPRSPVTVVDYFSPNRTSCRAGASGNGIRSGSRWVRLRHSAGLSGPRSLSSVRRERYRWLGRRFAGGDHPDRTTPRRQSHRQTNTVFCWAPE